VTVIRPATNADVDAITAIYAHHVLHGTGTFEEEPPTKDEMARRMGSVAGHGWPWLVAEDGPCQLGFAYAAQFRDRSAYRYSCEDSVYVHQDAMGRGIGGALLGALMTAATEAGFRRMLAVIGDSTNLGSIRLHLHHGFTHAGRFDGACHKFGSDLDVVFMQAALKALP
jgi:phosphinothricin acetyltransferase